MYGRRIFRSRVYLCLLASLVLQVGRAEFSSSDSDVLKWIQGDVEIIPSLINNQNALLDGISGNVYQIKSQIISDNDVIIGHLSNIEESSAANTRNTSEIIDILRSGFNVTNVVNLSPVITNNVTVNVSGTNSLDISSLTIAFSNAIASLPLCSVAVTNFINGSGNVDLTMVTNLWYGLAHEYYTVALSTWGIWPPGYKELVSSIWGDVPNADLYLRDYWRSSSTAMQYAFLASALNPTWLEGGESSFDNPLYSAWSAWFGYPGDDLLGLAPNNFVDYQYTVFDAYNTLGLGVLTNQVNLALEYLTNLTISANSTATAVSSVSDTLGDSQTVEIESNGVERVEWEPTYKEALDDNTNMYYWSEQARVFQDSMLEKTNHIKGFLQELNREGKSPLRSSLTWSGTGITGSQLGGWTLNVEVNPESPEYQDLGDLVRSTFVVLILFFDFAVVVHFMRLINNDVMHPSFNQ